MVNGLEEETQESAQVADVYVQPQYRQYHHSRRVKRCDTCNEWIFFSYNHRGLWSPFESGLGDKVGFDQKVPHDCPGSPA